MQEALYKSVWNEPLMVRSYDIGYNGTMRISNLCSHLQEVAARHAEHLGVGYTYMRSMGLAWVLSRLTLDIKRSPGWGEELILETWPLETGRILYRREYRLLSGDELLVTGSSYWMAVNLTSRRPVIVPIDKSVLEANTGRFAIAGTPAGLPVVEGCHPERFEVKYSDLDQNRHMNNARYVAWVFDHLGLKIMEDVPRVFTIEYKQEVRPGEALLLTKTYNPEEGAYYVCGRLEGSGKISLLARIEF
jgi:acyl-ACP thioesterase